jgi:hypothetical protein
LKSRVRVKRRPEETAIVWALILSLACCLLIVSAEVVPPPAGYVVCVTASCPQELVPIADTLRPVAR